MFWHGPDWLTFDSRIFFFKKCLEQNDLTSKENIAFTHHLAFSMSFIQLQSSCKMQLSLFPPSNSII